VWPAEKGEQILDLISDPGIIWVLHIQNG